ncbi:MAG: TIGR03032 family protein [Geminicoccaceae bacterium]
MNQPAPQTPAAQTPALRIQASRHFTAWLAEEGIGLAFTTYQSGKLFLLGLQPDGRLAVHERTFNRAMGLAVHEPAEGGRRLYLSTLFQLWRFDDILNAGQTHQGHDRLYVPRLAWTTGDLDIHDIALSADGTPVFVNTLFSCLATPDAATSFRPLWQPPFISRLAAEDRCHLNGLAMKEGRPAFVTAVARSDTADGWRDHRTKGGIVIDIATGETIAANLAMPHSPRLHDAGDGEKLYLLDSGTGRFGTIDQATGHFTEIAFCPGYARGLALHGRFAVIGLSRPRDNRTFQGLPLDQALAKRNAAPSCGLLVVDLQTGDTLHWLRLEGVVEELYDTAILPGTRRPMALGLKTDEIRRTISIGEPVRL